MATTVYTANIEKEGELYAALCPELDVASQGATVEEATANLREAVELFLECADPVELRRRLRTEIFGTRIEQAWVGFASCRDARSADSPAARLRQGAPAWKSRRDAAADRHGQPSRSRFRITASLRSARFCRSLDRAE